MDAANDAGVLKLSATSCLQDSDAASTTSFAIRLLPYFEALALSMVTNTYFVEALMKKHVELFQQRFGCVLERLEQDGRRLQGVEQNLTTAEQNLSTAEQKLLQLEGALNDERLARLQSDARLEHRLLLLEEYCSILQDETFHRRGVHHDYHVAIDTITSIHARLQYLCKEEREARLRVQLEEEKRQRDRSERKFKKVEAQRIRDEAEQKAKEEADRLAKKNADCQAQAQAQENQRRRFFDLTEKHCGRLNNAFLDAAFQGHLDAVLYFLDKGALTNAIDDQGCTALHNAVTEHHVEVTEQLLARDKLLVNIKDALGYSPLYRAVQKGFRDMVKILIAKGADVNSMNNVGETPLAWIQLYGKDEALEEMLQMRGAKSVGPSEQSKMMSLKGFRQTTTVKSQVTSPVRLGSPMLSESLPNIVSHVRSAS